MNFNKWCARELPPWEMLMKRIVWLQMGTLQGKRILDFGSGAGITANYFARENEVIAVEPSKEDVLTRRMDFSYQQLIGSIDVLKSLPKESFDYIICHNVLEYVDNREEIIKEFDRLLKREGRISIVKHHRPGRVMQMVVLGNEFEIAHDLLDGKDGVASRYGAIRYYEDSQIEKWCDTFRITKTLGMRAFWDLQQQQDIHKNESWQEKMIEMEMRVCDLKPYKDIAFFHHLFLGKNVNC